MKKQFNHNGKSYSVVITKKETGTNYNLFSSIYEGKSKSPLTGTSHKEGTPVNAIIESYKPIIETMQNATI